MFLTVFYLLPLSLLSKDIFYSWLPRKKQDNTGKVPSGDNDVEHTREHHDTHSETSSLLNDDASSKQKSHALVYLCFFIGGIALNLTWNAFSFIVPFWVLRYQPSIWGDFVVCYNAPGFPILILQLLSDNIIDKKMGSQKAYIFRILVSFLLVAGLAAVVPFTQIMMHDFTRLQMMIFATGIGIAVCAGHGWVYSLVSYFPNQAVSYLAAGGGAATLLLVGFTSILHYPNDLDIMQLYILFEPVFALSVLGTLCLVALLFSSRSKVIFSRADNLHLQQQQQDDGTPNPPSSHINNNNHHDGEDTLLKDTTPNVLSTPGPLFRYLWSPLLSIFLSLFSIVAAVVLITAIPSATNDPHFPTYILYVTSVAAFIGNEVAVYLKRMESPIPLLIFSILRFLLLPFLLVYSKTKFWLNDLFISGVASTD
eukprot:TRINITY_DN15684_c0_g1_i5.p1 TRINITY_DN15684_c0_g1~~TRINITY_DN15684_c0_g1_i5.p1  ORF type:complete len:424 (+),score=55.09 TRINITY_DN15684_c0_g1_i5:176-1447(+)